MKPPRLIGPALTAVRIAAETPGLTAVIREVMMRGLGIHELAALPAAWRGELRVHHRPIQARAARRWGDAALGALPTRAWPRSSLAYTAAYRDRATTPRRV